MSRILRSQCWQPNTRQQQLIADQQAKLFIQGQLLKENAAYADRLLQYAVYLAIDLAPLLTALPEESRRAWTQKIIHDAITGIQIQDLERLYEQPATDFVEEMQEAEEQEWS